MIAIPSLELGTGSRLRLPAKTYNCDMPKLRNPIDVAITWRRYGFDHLHLIDLEAATAPGKNTALIRTILNATGAEVQLSDEIGSADSIMQSLNDGAQRIVIGLRALDDPDWLAEMSNLFPGAIVVAVEVRDRMLVSHGWTRTPSKFLLDLVEELNAFPLAGVLVSVMSRRPHEMSEADLSLMEEVAESSDFPLFASGTIETIGDLRALADRGIAAAITGSALYAGGMDPRTVADEFAE